MAIRIIVSFPQSKLLALGMMKRVNARSGIQNNIFKSILIDSILIAFRVFSICYRSVAIIAVAKRRSSFIIGAKLANGFTSAFVTLKAAFLAI